MDTTTASGDAATAAGLEQLARSAFEALARHVLDRPEQVWKGTGTFTGAPFQGVRATGRRVTFRGCDVVEVRDRLVVDNTVYWDGAAFARDIGMLPERG